MSSGSGENEQKLKTLWVQRFVTTSALFGPRLVIIFAVEKLNFRLNSSTKV